MSPHPPPTPPPHILIIGAGITGLILAQSLLTHSIPFTICERDPSPSFRGKGWGLTIHWALDQFLALLPKHLKARLEETFVNPRAVREGEEGQFLFYDLQSGEARWRVPAARRMRVSRERLRALLMTGLDVQWNKKFIKAQPHPSPSNNTITAHFEDGSSLPGTMIIGCDGLHSQVRHFLCPTTYLNTPLPYRLLGASIPYPRTIAQPMRNLDPFFLQAGDPKTNSFLYFSFLDTPDNNTRADSDSYECQIIVSYPYRAGFLGCEEPIEVPEHGEGRVQLLKRITEGWTEPFRGVVQGVTSDTEVKCIKLAEWVPKEGAWDNLKGRITLLGDAAHTMTMYRGEAANHGIADITLLLSKFQSYWTSASSAEVGAASPATPFDSAKACAEYESEMIARTSRAVKVSTRAAEDAHNYAALSDASPLVNKRVMDV